jgi:hypothetical protein
MNNSKKILEFNFSDVEFIQHSKNVFNQNIFNALEININKLKEIGYEDKPIEIELDFQRTVTLKFKKYVSNLDEKEIRFDSRELRALCYSLSYSELGFNSILSDESELDLFLDLINVEWRESFLKGIVYVYFSNFNNASPSLQKLEIYIINRIANFDGGNAFFILLKNNLKYLSLKSGPITLGYELAIKNKKLSEITFAINRPKSWISFPYFSGVIYGYYERNKKSIVSFIDDLFLVLKEHNDVATYKRVISKLIIQANESSYESIRDLVKIKSLEIIGDPAVNTFWSPFENAVPSEKEDLKKAQIILNEWLTIEFVRVFFEECINEKRRKKFWLKHASNITSFKVYGPERIKMRLQKNRVIGKFVATRFSVTNSNQNKCAFVFTMGDYNLIEFSDEGYAFVANKKSQTDHILQRKSLQSIDDLRSSVYDDLLVKRRGYDFFNIKDAGRLFHKDGDMSWEQTFDYWLKQKIH